MSDNSAYDKGLLTRVGRGEPEAGDVPSDDKPQDNVEEASSAPPIPIEQKRNEAASYIPIKPDNPPPDELQQIREIQRRNTNYIFLFGAPGRGKTVITSSIVNFLSSVESEGQLSPFDVKEGVDKGNALLRKILWVFGQQRFPDRTALTENHEPIDVNVRFVPNDSKQKPVNMTFLEMSGESLTVIDAPQGGRGALPSSINVFFNTKDVSISFILVTEHSKAAEDDQLIASFINFVRDENKTFSNSRFLLLVTKWDNYDGGLSVSEFVKLNMRLTYAKLHDKRHSISDFTVGEVGLAGGEPFLKSFNPNPSKGVINWIYSNIYGHPIYKASKWKKIFKFI